MLCAITANAATRRGDQLLTLKPRRGSSIASLLPQIHVLARASWCQRLAARAQQPSFWLGSSSVHAPLGLLSSAALSTTPFNHCCQLP